MSEEVGGTPVEYIRGHRDIDPSYCSNPARLVFEGNTMSIVFEDDEDNPAQVNLKSVTAVDIEHDIRVGIMVVVKFSTYQREDVLYLIPGVDVTYEELCQTIWYNTSRVFNTSPQPLPRPPFPPVVDQGLIGSQ